MDRDEAIAAIKKSLKERSGKSWSVTGGRGTGYGWIKIRSLPSKQIEFGYMTEEDRAELGALLGKTVHQQGENIPASREYRQEYVDRAAGRTPSVIAQPYWD